MRRNQFAEAIARSVAPGAILENPGGGTSRIARVGDRSISYVRGSSTITVAMDDLFFAYERFRGGRVSSADLRVWNPTVFDSEARPAGHSCNCTFLFQMLQKIDLAGPMEGSGVRGDPYAVTLVEPNG